MGSPYGESLSVCGKANIGPITLQTRGLKLTWHIPGASWANIFRFDLMILLLKLLLEIEWCQYTKGALTQGNPYRV